MVQVTKDVVRKLNFDVSIEYVETLKRVEGGTWSGKKVLEESLDAGGRADYEESLKGLTRVVEENLNGNHEFSMRGFDEDEQADIVFVLCLDETWEKYRTGYAI